jgi:hypothetical protein
MFIRTLDSISLTEIKCRLRCSASCSIYIRPILSTCVVFLNLLREQIQLCLWLCTGCSDRSFQQQSRYIRYTCVTYGFMHVKLHIFDIFNSKLVSCAIIHILTAVPRLRTVRFVVEYVLLPVSSFCPCRSFHHCCVPTDVSSSVNDSPNHIVSSSVFKMGSPPLPRSYLVIE